MINQSLLLERIIAGEFDEKETDYRARENLVATIAPKYKKNGFPLKHYKGR